MRCAVVGHPAAHSLSPAIHRAAYQVLGLEWSYQAIDVEPGGLRAFVEGLDGSWRGLSVTMPHKADLVELGETDVTVDMLGAANTWVCRDGTTIVRNTDVTGAEAALRA
ncbi:MAG: shikimate dehydrogenase, partial [Actinomycetota bacterium]